MAQVIAVPIGALLTALTAVLWFAATSIRELPESELWMLLLSLAAIVMIHELLHVAVHPMAGRSSHSIVGLWPSRALFYAHYDGELTRNRLIAILLMPLLVISIVPLLIAATTPFSSAWIAFISTFNALLACVDVLGAGLVLFQIPATAIVRNQGWRTYWLERGSPRS